MANVIREDVVSLGFEVENDPFGELRASLEDMVGAVRELTQTVKTGFVGMGVEASAFASEVKRAGNDLASLGSGLNESMGAAENSLAKASYGYEEMLQAAQRYNAGLAASKDNGLGETAKNAKEAARGISEMARELARTAAAKIQAIPEKIKSSATAAREFAASLKATTFDKLTSGVDKLKSGFAKLKGMSIKDLAKGLDLGLGKAATKAAELGRGLKTALAAKGTGALKAIPEMLAKGVQKAKELGTALLHAAANGAKQLGGAMAKGLGTAAKGLATGVLAASVAVGGLAVAGVQAGIAYESAFAGVRKTVEMTEAEATVMSDAIREMSLNMPTSAVEIAAVAEAAGQLGIAKEDITGFTETMVMLGDSTNLTANEAATAFARFANVTGMDPGANAENYQRMGSSVVALGNNFATTEAEIANMAQNLASAGAQVGMSQADILGISAALSSVGMEADAGGTAMSKFMVEMQLAAETGGGKLQEIASIAGMSGAEFQQAFEEDAAGALTSFLGGLGNLDAAGPSAIALLDEMGINETRLRDALLRGANASDLFGDAIATSNSAWVENNALSNEANQRYSTMESQLGMLKNAVTDLGIEFYQGVNTPMAEVVGTAKDMVGQLKEAFTAGGMEGFAAELGNVLGQAVTKIAGALPGIVGLGVKLIQNLVQGIVQNAPAIAQGAAQAVTSFVLGIFQMLPTVILGAMQLILLFAQGILQNLPMIMQVGMQAVTQLINGIAAMLPAILVMAIQLIMAWLMGLVQNLPLLIEAGVNLVVALIEGLAMAIPLLIEMIPQLFTAFCDALMSVDWIDLGIRIVKAIWEGIKSIGSSLLDGFISLFTGGGAEIETPPIAADTTGAAAAGQLTGAGFTSGFEGATNIELPAMDTSGLTAGLTTAQPALNSFAGSADMAGASTLALGNSMTTASAGFTAASTGAGQLDMAMAGLDTSLQTSGTNMGLSLDTLKQKTTDTQTGMSGEMTTITTNVQAMVASIQAALDGLAEPLYTSGVNAMTGFNNGLEAMRETVLATAASIASGAAAAMQGALDIHSPSRVVEQIGVYTGMALPLGMESQRAEVQRVALALAGDAVPPVERARGPVLQPRSPESAPLATRGGDTYHQNRYSPQFSLSVGGGATAGDRELERKVKAWVAEAFQRAIDGAQRGGGARREV